MRPTAPVESPEGGVYTFVTDEIASALAQDRVVAGEGDRSEKLRLRLADSKAVGDGIAILVYEFADAGATDSAS